MDAVLPLMQREWLQHRFAWAMLVLVPLSLALLLVGFGQIRFDDGEPDRIGEALPAAVALAAIAGCMVLLFVIAWASSLFIATGIARRDHGDRSIEFWLSLPTSHTRSLAVPLVVHLILVPAAALVIGLLGGYLVSLILVGRYIGFGAWSSLPWGDVLAASLSVALRLAAGLPLATLWLAPVILLAVLVKAWIGRWGLPVMALALGLGGLLLDRALGQPLVLPWLGTIGRNAARAMVGAGGAANIHITSAGEAFEVLGMVPGIVLADFGAALQALASPVLLFGLLLGAGCFALLVDWRRRGSKAPD